MNIHASNERIDYLLRWENREMLARKLYRDSLRNNQFTAALEYKPKTLPDNSGYYFTYSWDAGLAPANVKIDVLVDRFPPSDSGLPGKPPSPLHNHDFFEILYVYSGTCTTLIDGRKTLLQSGDICLYNLQAIHRVQMHNPGDTLFNIIIHRDLFQESLQNLLAENDLITDFFIQSLYSIKSGPNQIVLHADSNFNNEQIVQWMIEYHYGDEPMEQSMLKALMLLLLMEMTRQYRASFPSESNQFKKELSLRRVIGYIEQNCHSITLEQVASQFGYSTRSMSRYFKATTGSTFKQLAQQVRFHQACIQLRNSSQNINDIAASIGYTERSSFDRAFKAMYQLTPSEYRLRYQQNRQKDLCGV